MKDDSNFIMTKTVSAICINAQEWFYEGQLVNIIDKKLGTLNNVIITCISDTGDRITVTDSNDKNYFLNPKLLAMISHVERRRHAVSL